ncbi:MAG: Uncharacterized protein G01um101466_135 [Parcubacteria group bacterium Gr01-1014_66]|nr:MAG: Uncharacterized protein G01um101466_135 [Parcubacteria group bacterium Gr01-1014_66]
MKKFHTLSVAEQFLGQFIPKGEKSHFDGPRFLARAKKLLDLLGNPQEEIQVIHVAGTSGKGSTAFLVSRLFSSHGIRVGLHLSPHLCDIRERVQINNQLVPEKDFLDALEELVPCIEKMKHEECGIPSYFEILVACAFYLFAQKKVAVAVMETGMGGRYDATNTVLDPSKIGLITRIGLDHTKVLGRTLEKIAYEKAMITQKGNCIFTISQHPHVSEVIEKTVHAQGGILSLLKPKRDYWHRHTYEEGSVGDIACGATLLKNVRCRMLGRHQIENAALACAGFALCLSRFGITPDENKIRDTLMNAVLPGRMQIVKIGHRTVIFDGAHNPQKIRALVKTIQDVFPGTKLSVLFACKENKDAASMLGTLIPIASRIMCSSFFHHTQDLSHVSYAPDALKRMLEKIGFSETTVARDGRNALESLLAETKKEPIVVTGSLYFLALFCDIILAGHAISGEPAFEIERASRDLSCARRV